MELLSFFRSKVSLKNSLGARLLKTVFGFYLIVAIAVTTGQLAFEYLHVKTQIHDEIESLETTFTPGIAVSLWDMSSDQLSSILLGMHKIPSIIGVKIQDEHHQEVQSLGLVLDEHGKAVEVDPSGKRSPDTTSSYMAGFFWHDFPIPYTDRAGVKKIIGYGTIYSSTDIIVARVKYDFILIIVNSLIKSAALWWIFLFFIRKYVSIPLEQLASAADSVKPEAEDFLTSPDFLLASRLDERKDEVGQLSRSFSQMRRVIIEKIEALIALSKSLRESEAQVQRYSEGLEKLVEERTNELREALQLRSLTLDSLGQGFLVVDRSGACLPYCSRACSTLLETNPAGKPLGQVLKAAGAEDGKFAGRLKLIFDGKIRESDLERFLPRTFPHSGGKHIQLSYRLTRESNNSVSLLVAIATDVTSLVEAEKREQQQKEEANRVLRVAEDKTLFLTLVREVRKCVDLMRTSDDLPSIRRSLHTIKGMAGSYSLTGLRETAHELENQWGPGGTALSARGALAGRFESELEAVLQQLSHLLGQDFEKRGAVREIPVAELERLFASLAAGDPSGQAAASFRSRFLLSPLSDCFRPFDDELQSVASRLGKKVNPIQIECQGDLRVNPEDYREFLDSLGHLFRNIVDHGIEKPEERERLGKPAEGNVQVVALIASNVTCAPRLRIEISDDGAGVNLEKVAARLVAQGRADVATMSEEQLLEAIFLPGLSTRDSVDSLSGRGIGMDAVREAVLRAGGELKGSTVSGHGTRFTFSLPLKSTTISDARPETPPADPALAA